MKNETERTNMTQNTQTIQNKDLLRRMTAYQKAVERTIRRNDRPHMNRKG